MGGMLLAMPMLGSDIVASAHRPAALINQVGLLYQNSCAGQNQTFVSAVPAAGWYVCHGMVKARLLK